MMRSCTLFTFTVGLLCLAELLARNISLKYLNISRNWISKPPAGIHLLAKALERNNCLKVLKMRKCDLNLDDSRHIIMSLKNNEVLERLDISDNVMRFSELKPLVAEGNNPRKLPC